mgnify:CR=1 FL=1
MDNSRVDPIVARISDIMLNRIVHRVIHSSGNSDYYSIRCAVHYIANLERIRCRVCYIAIFFYRDRIGPAAIRVRACKYCYADIKAW